MRPKRIPLVRHGKSIGRPSGPLCWTLPVTTFSIRDDHGLAPTECVDDLAYLMSMAPGNHEKRGDLECNQVTLHIRKTGIIIDKMAG